LPTEWKLVLESEDQVLHVDDIKERKKTIQRLMKILVVDDEPESCRYLSTPFCAGHAVFGITGGADVTSWVQKHNCDLLLLDVSLPDVNGLNKISEVLSRSPKTQGFVMSGLHKGTWRRRAEKRCVDCIEKPIELDKLQRLVDQIAAMTKTTPKFPD